MVCPIPCMVVINKNAKEYCIYTSCYHYCMMNTNTLLVYINRLIAVMSTFDDRKIAELCCSKRSENVSEKNVMHGILSEFKKTHLCTKT